MIYNADYDLRLMAQTSELYGITPIETEAGCAMLAYAEFYGEWNDSKRNLPLAEVDQCRRPTGCCH